MGDDGETLSIFVDETEVLVSVANRGSAEIDARVCGGLVVVAQFWKAVFSRIKKVRNESVTPFEPACEQGLSLRLEDLTVLGGERVSAVRIGHLFHRAVGVEGHVLPEICVPGTLDGERGQGNAGIRASMAPGVCPIKDVHVLSVVCQVVRSVDAAFVASDHEEVVAFQLCIGRDGGGMSAEFASREDLGLGILEFASGPDDVLGHEGPFVKMQMIQSVLLLDGVDVGVLQNRDFEEGRDVLEVLGILLARWVLDLHAERRRDAHCDGVQVEHADGIAREGGRNEPRLSGPLGEGRTHRVPVDDEKFLHACMAEGDRCSDACSTGADDDGVILR